MELLTEQRIVWYTQSEHKIQSGKGSLLIEMDQVPKILKPMVDEWTRDGFIVSFKVRSHSPSSIPPTPTPVVYTVSLLTNFIDYITTQL